MREWFRPNLAVPRRGTAPRQCPARVASRPASRIAGQLVGDTGEIVSIEAQPAPADHKTLFREYGATAGPVAAAAERALDNW